MADPATTHPLWRPFVPAAIAPRQAHRVDRRQVAPGPFQQDHDRWAAEFLALRTLIERAIPGQVLALHHVGSTAIPGLIAKPIIDMDLTLVDPLDEARYRPGLEAVGFRLIFRDELGGSVHRQFTFGDPNANLHVWSPDAVEPQRHALFVRWLRENPTDRALYAAAKRSAAGEPGTHYNDAKAAVVYDIYERAFLADPVHVHEHQPRSATGPPPPGC
jgi:GrpB-like predicted nucleotidyltransferase (UPF0157 family)